MGLVGDLSYGTKKRQVLLIEGETLAEFGLAPGRVQENVVVQGKALAGTPPGTRLALGETVLEVTGDCAPCAFIDDIRPGLREAMAGRRGTLAVVVSGGAIRAGDALRVLAGAGSASPAA
jgi:MOSC domain-containing protein YiiM